MQVINNGDKNGDSKSYEDKLKAEKKLVEEIKVEWKLLWTERFNDKAKAEDVSVADYEHLYVSRGTVIHATRDFKALNFKDILNQNMVNNPDRYVPPEIQVGGWNKFIKTKITNNANRRVNPSLSISSKKDSRQQPKKGGRGWVHKI